MRQICTFIAQRIAQLIGFPGSGKSSVSSTIGLLVGAKPANWIIKHCEMSPASHSQRSFKLAVYIPTTRVSEPCYVMLCMHAWMKLKLLLLRTAAPRATAIAIGVRSVVRN